VRTWFAWRVLVIGLPVAEIVLLIWVASQLGWGWVFLILLAGFLAGLALMRAAGAGAYRAAAVPWRRTQPYVEIDETTGTARTVHPASGPTPEDVAEAGTGLKESGLLFVAGCLLAIPGLLSDVAGLVLALPGVRRRLARRDTTAPDGVVVQGETVVVDTHGGVHVQTWGPQARPDSRVIRGEILPPPSTGR
jgi:UPF0716 protein FxsA